MAKMLPIHSCLCQHVYLVMPYLICALFDYALVYLNYDVFNYDLFNYYPVNDGLYDFFPICNFCIIMPALIARYILPIIANLCTIPSFLCSYACFILPYLVCGLLNYAVVYLNYALVNYDLFKYYQCNGCLFNYTLYLAFVVVPHWIIAYLVMPYLIVAFIWSL